MKIIVNADDFGSSRSINEAISLAFSYGYIQRTSIMVNMPFFERLKNSGREYAQQWLEEFGNDVGVKSSLDLSKVYY